MSAGVHADVSFRDVTIKIPDRRCGQGCEWCHDQKRRLRFEKSQLVEFCRRRKKVDFRLLALALRRVRTWFGADGKVVIERWYLAPYVEKPLNSKLIKSFVPKLRSRKCFSCFGIPMLSIYELWTFYVHFPYSYLAMLQCKWLNKSDNLKIYLILLFSNELKVCLRTKVIVSFILRNDYIRA